MSSKSSSWTDHITASIHITAPPATVFSILSHTAAYPTWNPFILSLTPGPLTATSTRITAVIRSGGSGSMTFTPIVQQYKQDESVVWQGRLLLGGLFDGRHSFHVRAEEGGSGCVFVHEEQFSGLVIWLGRVTGAGWYRNLMAGTEEGFRSMNEALKQRAEAEVKPSK